MRIANPGVSIFRLVLEVAEKGFVFDCLKQPVMYERVDRPQQRILLPCPLSGVVCSSGAGGGRQKIRVGQTLRWGRGLKSGKL